MYEPSSFPEVQEVNTRVFDPNTVTAAISQDGATVSVGAVDLKYVKSLSVDCDSESGIRHVVVEFFRSHDAAVSREIEQNVRLARTLPWLAVRY